MKTLRQHRRERVRLPANQVSAIGYWRRGHECSPVREDRHPSVLRSMRSMRCNEMGACLSVSGRCSASWITAAATPRITSTSRELALDVIAAVLTGGNRWEGLLMPPAELAWLDHSQADQRRAREIVALFSQRESRDDQGLGGVRDALSDTLFPGTSVLLTRARYLLFVPWLFREGGRRRHVGPQLVRWVERQERRLIGALREGGDLDGLIGRNVGPAVRNLPSNVYWNSLRSYGILRHDGTMAQVAGLRQITSASDDATEFIERSDAV